MTESTFIVVYVADSHGKEKGAPNKGGKYVSKRGGGAAVKKAFSQICNASKISGVCTLVIGIRKTGSDKVRYYMCTRSKLDKPVERKIGDRVVINRFETKSKYLGMEKPGASS